MYITHSQEVAQGVIFQFLYASYFLHIANPGFWEPRILPLLMQPGNPYSDLMLR